jgi:hypothetical protein
MRTSLVIFTFIVVVAISNASATYARTSGKTTPIENFTRSLAAYYVVLKQCSGISRGGNESDINKITKYLGNLYPRGIPYWALPDVGKSIDDEDVCSYLMYERAIAYQQARLNYKRQYPREALPPEFAINQPANFYTVDRVLFGDKSRLELEW